MSAKLPDAVTENHGTVALLRPVSDAAREWIEQNVHIEPWQRINDAIACEPRLLADLVDVMQAEGFTIAESTHYRNLAPASTAP